MTSAAAQCPACGTTLVEGSCSRCLLQLGLTVSGASLGTRGSNSSPRASVSGDPISQSFFRQGVLPRFGDYELESEIARGGMGVVYRARQKSLNRAVAVKMILAGQLATPESVQRFRLEAEAAAKLHHPGIVQIYEIGECETQHFFSMELIEGTSLAECMPELRLKRQTTYAEKREQEQCIAELIATVARSLDFAHQRGVLHRDLKPSNILIDELGQPHLTDFGLAKLTGRETSGLTLSTAVLGTPGYLAPEQAAGRVDEVTTAADVYGLGATLYELLTGQPPFAGSTAVETLLMAINAPPLPPRQLNPAVDRDLETIVQRCLEKNPARRYASAAMVADELERFVRREPILARPVSRVEHAWRWCQRNPWLSLLTCALAMTILVGSGTALWQWMRAERANVTLTENLEHLEWGAIDTMLERNQSSQALAKVAAMLRADPQDSKAAMFAMSVMEQRRFPVPVSPQIRHPQGAELSVARLSPDGTRIVTASFDGTARLWDAATCEPTAPPLEHQGPVIWAEFSPDGSRLVTCSQDKTVRLWDVASGRAIGEPYRHDESVTKVQYSADGQYLLSRTNRTVAILDGKDAQVRVGPLEHEGAVLGSRFVSGGAAFFTASRAAEASIIRVWNLPTGKEQASLNTEPLRAADVSDDLTHIAAVDAKGNGWVAQFPSGAERKEINNFGAHFHQVSFNRSGDLIAAVSGNHWTRVWNTHTALPVTGELSHYYLLEGVSFLGNGERLLSWADDSLAQVWDVATSQPYCEPMRHNNRVIRAEAGVHSGGEVFLTTMSHLKSRTADTQTGSAQLWRVHAQEETNSRLFGTDAGAHDGGKLSADGLFIARATTKQELWVQDRATGATVCGPMQVRGGAWGLLFTPDAKRLIAATSRGQVSMWSIPEGKLIAAPVELNTTFQPLEMSQDGKWFATGSTDQFVRIWDTATGQPIHMMKHGSEINSVAFSPDSRLLASAGENRLLRVWDTATGTLVHELSGHANEVMSVAFSPDGRRLASASLDFTGRIWHVVSGKELAVLPHQGEVLDVRFSPDGHWVATGARDRTAVIWDATTGVPHSRNLLHQQGVRNLQFSPDGKQLLTLDFRGLRLWDVATSHPLTVHLPHMIFGGTGFQGSTGRPSFTPDGKSVLVSMDTEESRLWHFSMPAGAAPEWFPELLEAVAGQRFAIQSDLPELVPPESFLTLQRRLRSLTDDDFYTRWAQQWLSAAQQPRSATSGSD